MQLLHTFEHVLTCVPLPTFVLSDLPGLVLLPGTLNGQRRVLAGPVGLWERRWVERAFMVAGQDVQIMIG